MKSISFLFAGLFLLSLSACKKDATGDIPGSWKVTAITYAGTTTTADPSTGVSYTSTFTGEGTNMDLQISFAENPNTYTTTGSYDILLTTMLNGQSLISTWTNADFVGNGSWSRTGDTLTFTDSNGETSEVTIVSLTDSTLKVNWQFTNVQVTQGATSTSNVDGMYTFERM